MPYKNLIPNNKKYISPFYKPKPSYLNNPIGTSVHKEEDFFGIPLPNEKESLHDFIPIPEERKRPVNPLGGIIRYLQKNVKVEELLLVGLIILLLDESLEDDLLLIALIYILLF